MSIHRKIFHGGLTLGFNQGFTQACSFLRNVIVARILSPADFGIAAIFFLTFSLLDMMSNLSADKLLVQAVDGGDPAFQDSAQALQAMRGVMNAVIIFALGGPVARLFGVPQTAWAFRVLALLPVLRGFTHLDLSRVQRELKFAPQVVSDSVSALVVTLAVIPLSFWFRDYSLMLWLLVIQSAASLLLSHRVADRHYRWAWDRKYVKRMVTFGWPLLINGVLLYIIFEGDRFVIGASHWLFAQSTYTLADLGIYSVAFGLAMAPNTLVGNVSTSLFLPLLSQAQNDRQEFRRRYAACAELVAAVATLIAIGFIVAGGPFVVLIYGHKYAGAEAFIGWLGAMWTLRTLRLAPTLAALSLGDTLNSMVSNITRTAALGGVLLAAATGQSMIWIAISGFLGEVLALAVCVLRLQKEHGIAPISLFRPFTVCGAGMFLASLTNASGFGQATWLGAFASAGALVVVMIAVMLAGFPELRTGMRLMIKKSEPIPTAAAAVPAID